MKKAVVLVLSTALTGLIAGYCLGFYSGREIYRDRLLNSVADCNRLLASYHDIKVIAIQMLIDKHMNDTGDDEE